MLICPKCGYDNELGRIFCHQCGTKLDLDQIRGPGQGGPSIKRRDSPSVGKIVLRIAEVLILVVLVFGTYLLVQVPDVKPVATTPADQTSAEKKFSVLSAAVDHRKPASIQLSEAEANAYLDRLGFEPGDSKGVRIVPIRIQMEFDQGVVDLIMQGRLDIGGTFHKQIYLKYRGMPIPDRGELTFKPVAAEVGGLPIHPSILDSTTFIPRYFAALFRNLSDERDVLGKLTSISVEPRRAILNYQLPAAGK